jgi:hypothetical protein
MRTTTASPIRGTTTPVTTSDRQNPSGQNPSGQNASGPNAGGQNAKGQNAEGQNERGGGALGDVKEIGTELASAVRDSATSLFEEQRNRAADEIAALGEALRQSARSLDQNGGTVARYADQAAQQVGNFASTLRTRSWNEMAADVEDFGRRWPLAFMAAAIGVGFAAGRFLMASAARSSEQATSGTTPTHPMAQAGAGSTGTVTGSVSGGARSGYGAMASRENG